MNIGKGEMNPKKDILKYIGKKGEKILKQFVFKDSLNSLEAQIVQRRAVYVP